MDDLPEQGPECASGHDDGSFGAERTPGSDRDRRREGLGDRRARRDPALLRQDGLHSLRDAVASDHR